MLSLLERLNMVCHRSEGLGKMLLSMIRLGSADKGVSICSRVKF